MQFEYDNVTFVQCCMAALSAWDKVEDTGKGCELFSRIMQAPKETYTDFLQRSTLTVDRRISNPEARQELMVSLSFKNTNSEFKNN